MSIRKRMVLPVALALGALGMMVMATAASATHPRPVGASPLRASMVPAYNACATPNRTHGPPLAFPSCNPPVQSSTSLTIGSPDANGAGANSVGFIKLGVVVGTPGPPDDSDVNIMASATDIRCKAGVAACGSANAADGADYTGELEGTAQIRISDHFNAVAPGGGTDPATVIDIPFPVVTPCIATASTAVGSTCCDHHHGERGGAGRSQGREAGDRRDRPAAGLRRRHRRCRSHRPEHAVQRPGDLHPLALDQWPEQSGNGKGRERQLPAFRYFGRHDRRLITFLRKPTYSHVERMSQ